MKFKSKSVQFGTVAMITANTGELPKTIIKRKRGRPVKTDGAYVVKLSVSLPAEIAQRTKELARTQGKPVSCLVSDMLQRCLQENFQKSIAQ